MQPLHPPPPPVPAVWLLVVITLTGTIGMHIFVPALPSATQAFGAQGGELQWTISIYIAGLALGQLLYGPLSDGLGRVPVLRTGLAVYVAGSIACALAPSVPALLAARLVQSIGAGAGLALGRAIVRDTSTREAAVPRLALLNILLVFGPGLAPMLGGVVTAWGGWRSVFVVLAATGLITLVLTWMLLPETRPQGEAMRARQMLAGYGALLRSPAFAGLAIASGCSIFSMYAFLAAAPFIFAQLHQPVALIGVYTGIIVFGSAIGGVLAVWLSRRHSPRTLLFTANWIHVACIATMLTAALLGKLTVFNVVAAMSLYMVGNGIANPVSITMAMDASPRLVGSAAGLLGCIHLAIGAICTAAAALGKDPAVSAFVVMAVAAAIATTTYIAALGRKSAG